MLLLLVVVLLFALLSSLFFFFVLFCLSLFLFFLEFELLALAFESCRIRGRDCVCLHLTFAVMLVRGRATVVTMHANTC